MSKVIAEVEVTPAIIAKWRAYYDITKPRPGVMALSVLNSPHLRREFV